MLIDSKLPLVGHNLLYDLLFIINHFDRPLPDTWVEFQQRISHLFPIVFDTKYLAENMSVSPRIKKNTVSARHSYV